MNEDTVVITDIKMRFGSMVVFMIKMAIAAVPAAIVLTLLYSFLFGAIFTAIKGVG